MTESHEQHAPHGESVELPSATIWPLVLAVGVTMLAAGVATSSALSAVGIVMIAVSLYGWVGELIPGRGHMREPMVAPELRAKPITGEHENVIHLEPGMVGYRFQLPVKMHPISSGIKGGIVGGLAMPIPALAYGLLSGHGIWFPINLLAGMVVPNLTDASVESLERFSLGALLLGAVIHAVFSLGFGLMYGVLMPTLPPIPGATVIAGAFLMPVIWSALCYGFLGIINPLLEEHVDWRFFIVSQFVYGLVMSLVVIRTEKVYTAPISRTKGDKP